MDRATKNTATRGGKGKGGERRPERGREKERGKPVERGKTEERGKEEEKRKVVERESVEERGKAAVPGPSRSRSVSVRRRRNSRDSSAGSKKRRLEGEDDVSECDVESECESVRDECVESELGVCKELSASVVTVRGCDERERDELSRMRGIGERLRKCVFSDANRVNKSVSECILNCVGEYEECLMRMMCENERLKGRLDECNKRASVNGNVSVSPVQGVSARSFASVVGSKSSVGMSVKQVSVSEPMSVSEKKFAVVIKPKDDGSKMTSEQVKEKVMNEVSKCLNVRVKAVRKTRSGGIAVETVSEKEMISMRECKKFEAIGLRVDEPRKIGPKVIVFDVPCSVTNEDLLSELYAKNLSECVSENEFKERVRVVSRTNKKDASVGNCVFEVSVRMFNKLMSEGRVYVQWRACKVREFVNVLRCHKCCAFGHMAKECKEKESVCQKCGEFGHLRSDCKKSECCRNCRVKGNKSDHSVTSTVCPEYVRMAERERARICID